MAEVLELAVTAFPGALLLDGGVYYFATLMRDGAPMESEDEIYRHRDQLALYGDGLLLEKHLAEDAIPAEQAIFDIIDIDRALEVPRLSIWAEAEIEVVLTAWNGLDDLMPALGLPFEFRGLLANKALDKLFWGLNLPSVTPAGLRYVPIWSKKETRKISQVLRAGASRIRRIVMDVAAQPRDDLWCTHEIAPHNTDDGQTQLRRGLIASG